MDRQKDRHGPILFGKGSASADSSSDEDRHRPIPKNVGIGRPLLFINIRTKHIKNLYAH